MLGREWECNGRFYGLGCNRMTAFSLRYRWVFKPIIFSPLLTGEIANIRVLIDEK